MPNDVDLGPELEQVVRDLVASGRFASRYDVLREGARLAVERGRQLDALEDSLQRGIADDDAGRVHSTHEVVDHLHLQLSKRSAA